MQSLINFVIVICNTTAILQFFVQFDLKSTTLLIYYQLENDKAVRVLYGR